MSTVQLSPLTIANLADNIGVLQNFDELKNKAKARVREVVHYQCPSCLELHDSVSEAAECCLDVDAGDACGCPVCSQGYLNYRDAADCCLWHDLDVMTRRAIADAVENGSTWLEELKMRGFYA